MGDSLFDSIFMVSFKANEKGSLSLVVTELPTNTFLSVVISLDILLIALTTYGLWITGIVGIQGTHICAITKVNYIIRLQVIQETTKPIKPLVTHGGV